MTLIDGVDYRRPRSGRTEPTRRHRRRMPAARDGDRHVPAAHNRRSRCQCARRSPAAPARSQGSPAMSLLSRLERRFGRFAIPNLTTDSRSPGRRACTSRSLLPQGVSLDRVVLDPAQVMRGRSLAAGHVPVHAAGDRPDLRASSTSCCSTCSARRSSTTGARFATTCFCSSATWPTSRPRSPRRPIAGTIGDRRAGRGRAVGARSTASNGFLYSSIFLAFARLFPDFIINLFFVLPIRIKWLALLHVDRLRLHRWPPATGMTRHARARHRAQLPAVLRPRALCASCATAIAAARSRRRRRRRPPRRGTSAACAGSTATTRRGRCSATARSARARCATAPSTSAITST